MNEWSIVYVSIIREAPRQVWFDLWDRAPEPPSGGGQTQAAVNHVGQPPVPTQRLSSSEESDSPEDNIPPLHVVPVPPEW